MRQREKKYLGNLLRYSAIVISLASATSSCDWIQIKKIEETAETGKPLARVKDKYLFQADIEGIAARAVNAEDSANTVNRYINNWIKKQLLISEASLQIEFDQAEIERKILDYRYALMVYEFEKRHVSNNLKKEVSDAEIEEYYHTNKDNFQLKQNILRCVFLQAPKESPRLKDIKNAMNGNDENSKSQLKSLSLRLATKSFLEDTVWLKFDEVFRSVPVEATNRVQFLRENKNRLIEVTDDNYVYLVKIYDYKIKEEISPLEFVKEDIKTIIINKRKTILAKKLEDDIYNIALKNKDFEVYVEK